MSTWRIVLLLPCILAAVSGCRRPIPASEAAGPITVSVSEPIQRDVTDFAQFTGQTAAVNSVEIKSRVTGYLLKTPFKEGSEIKVGDMLCEIDPQTYQAQLNVAQGQLLAAEAKLKLAKTENERAKSLYQENPKAISLKALDQHQAEEDSAAADVVAAKSSVEVYQLNVKFTKITSPIDGRIGRYLVTTGNLVTENVTTLTTIVSDEPIYAYFNIDEQTMLRILRSLYKGTLPPLSSRKVRVNMGLQDEGAFPHQGTADFANNTVDPSTGTLTVRAVFKNPANTDGIRLLMPGMFVRIQLPLGLPAPAVLVAAQAVGTDQGQKYLYVVDDGNTVHYRQVTLGPLQDDGMRVITEGLKRGESVIVSGLQLVRPGMKVKTEKVSMTMHDTMPPTDKSSTSAPSTETDNN
jgi:multidrug efflux system membrane fusion protein